MKQSGKHILKQSEPLTHTETKCYLANQAKGKEKHFLEEKISGNPLNDDAIDGFINFPDELSEMDELKARFSKVLTKQRKSTTRPSRIVFIGILAIGIIFTLYLQWNLSFKLFDIRRGVSETKIINGPTRAIVPPTGENSLEPVDLEEEQTEMDNEILTTVERAQISIPEFKDNTSAIAKRVPNLIDVPDKDPESMNAIAKEIPTTIEMPKRTTFQKSSPMTIIADFYVVDYTREKRSPIKKLNSQLGGTDPQYADKLNDKQNNLENKYAYVPYVKYLEISLLDFGEHNFYDALNRFGLISKQYPDDINGLFYSALCYYYLDKPKNAILKFDAILAMENNSFHEEAAWYKALSYLKMDNQEQARKLLGEIIIKDGFYAEKAVEKLREIGI